MNRKAIAAQGEVRVYCIDAIPEGVEAPVPEKNRDGHHIISHSERGHHHVLSDHAEVLVREHEGMQTFYAILKKPGCLKQDGPDPHERIDLEPGLYELRPDQEYNPFTEQARRVAD